MFSIDKCLEPYLTGTLQDETIWKWTFREKVSLQKDNQIWNEETYPGKNSEEFDQLMMVLHNFNSTLNHIIEFYATNFARLSKRGIKPLVKCPERV